MNMRNVTLALCLLWMGFIFYNSSQTGEQSNDKSMAIIDSVANNKPEINTDDNIKESSFANASEYMKKINLFIRKFAHFGEFFILAILFSLFFKSIGVSGINAVVYVLFIVLLYAVSDEFHQLYVPGRTARVQDIVVDFCGGIVGVSIFCFLKKQVVKSGVYSKKR